MKFKAKVFKLGNSRAMYIPKSFEIGQEYEFVYTSDDVYTEKESDVYTPEEKKAIAPNKYYNPLNGHHPTGGDKASEEGK